MGDRNLETDRVSISLPKELNEEFEKLRTSLGMTRSDAIRKAMKHFLDSERHTLSQVDASQPILGIISYLEEAHVHAHPVQDPNIPHTHGEMTHTHGDHNYPQNVERENLKKYSPPANQIEYIKINEIQHEFLDCIISTTHIHADINQCLLIISVRGKFERIKDLYKELSSFKTIKEINLSIFPV